MSLNFLDKHLNWILSQIMYSFMVLLMESFHHLVPHAMSSSLLQRLISGTKSVIPPSLTLLLSKSILPLIVLTTDSGCSNISFCIKVVKFPFIICCISIFKVVISRPDDPSTLALCIESVPFLF